MIIEPLIFQSFKFKKPIQLEEAGFGYGVIATNDKTIVQLENNLPSHVMPFVWARAKLAEINPLIVTLPIPDNCSMEEVALYQVFDYLCEPIREAWTWKMLRRHVAGLHKVNVQKLADAIAQPTVGIIANWMDMLNAYCIMREGGSAGFSLVVDKRLQEYVDSVAEFSQREPNASLYEELAYRLGGPSGIKRIAALCLVPSENPTAEEK